MTHFDQILRGERHQMTSWARSTLVEARVAGTAWGLIGHAPELAIGAHRQVEEIAERLHQGFLQVTAGQSYTLNQWKDEVHQLRSRFTVEVLQLALSIATRKLEAARETP